MWRRFPLSAVPIARRPNQRARSGAFAAPVRHGQVRGKCQRPASGPVCLDPTKTGDITKTGILWSYDKLHRSISTCAITPDGLLFIGDFSGFVHCLDAETGKPYWVHDMKAHIWGSPLAADGKVYIGAEDGSLTVFAASKEKKVLNEINMGAPVYSTPVVANGVLYVQTTTHLYAITQPKK